MQHVFAFFSWKAEDDPMHTLQSGFKNINRSFAVRRNIKKANAGFVV